MEDSVQNSVWIMLVSGHAIRAYERPSNFSSIYQQCLEKVSRRVCSSLLGRHPGILQNVRGTRTARPESPTGTKGCRPPHQA